MFSFVATFIGLATGCTKKAPNSVVHSEYSSQIRLHMNVGDSNKLRAVDLAGVGDKVAELKKFEVESL